MPPKRKGKALPPTENAEKEEESSTIFFYMPGDKPYGVFCQWHPSTFTIPTASLHFLTTALPPNTAAAILSTYDPAITFNCTEQSFMFSKALYFADGTTCARILATPDPHTQKVLGRTIANFDNDEWLRVKGRALRVGNWYKFSRRENRAMKDVLLGTGDREIAEAARRDRSCGIGYRAEEAERYRKFWGDNLLGKALGVVRGRLREWVRREVEEGEIVDWMGMGSCRGRTEWGSEAVLS